MTEPITCQACKYTRQPTDDTADWECPNCHKAYNKTTSIEPQQRSEGRVKIENPPSSSCKPFTMWVLMAASLFTPGMMIYASQPWHKKSGEIIGLIIFMVGFGAWNITPYLILWHEARKFCSTARQRLTLLVGTIMIAVFGAHCLIDTMFVHTDAQGALIFIFLPVWQMIGVAVTVGVAESRWAKVDH